MAALVVLGGRPGVGKTALSRDAAQNLGAVYLRIDAIEQALRDAGLPASALGPAGYGVAQTVAEANLRHGLVVVADCVNPVPESRDAWRAVAMRTGAALLEVEVICSDASEHRRRVENRIVDVPGLDPPSWDVIERLDYRPWDRDRLVIDTAQLSEAGGVARLVEAVRGLGAA